MIKIYLFVISLALLNAQQPVVFKKCIFCHGIDGLKIAPGSRGGVQIAGLSKDKLLADLRGYRARTADNGGAKTIMYEQAKHLNDKQIQELADYISKLPKK